jgi:hypothetical protein
LGLKVTVYPLVVVSPLVIALARVIEPVGPEEFQVAYIVVLAEGVKVAPAS